MQSLSGSADMEDLVTKFFTRFVHWLHRIPSDPHTRKITRSLFLVLTAVLFLTACSNQDTGAITAQQIPITLETPQAIPITKTPTPLPTVTLVPEPTLTATPTVEILQLDGEYPVEIQSMIATGEFDWQIEQFMGWYEYWESSEDEPVLDRIIQPKLIWDKTKNGADLAPEDVGVLFEFTEEGKTVYFPKKVGEEGYRMDAPSSRNQPYSLATGESYLQLSGGSEGLELSWVGGDWARIRYDDKGKVEVLEIIDREGHWLKSKVLAEQMGMTTRDVYPDPAAREYVFEVRPEDGKRYLVDKHNDARMAVYDPANPENPWTEVTDLNVMYEEIAIGIHNVFARQDTYGTVFENRNWEVMRTAILPVFTGNWHWEQTEYQIEGKKIKVAIIETVGKTAGGLIPLDIAVGYEGIPGKIPIFERGLPGSGTGAEIHSSLNDLLGHKLKPGQELVINFVFQRPYKLALPRLEIYSQGVATHFWYMGDLFERDQIEELKWLHDVLGRNNPGEISEGMDRIKNIVVPIENFGFLKE